MSRAVAQLCVFLGIKGLTEEQEIECLQIMRDNFERFDPNELWREYKKAKDLQCSLIEAEMRIIEADELMRLKYRGPTQ